MKVERICTPCGLPVRSLLPPEERRALVKVAELMLAEAKAGRLYGVAIAAIGCDEGHSTFATVWQVSGWTTPMEMQGAIQALGVRHAQTVSDPEDHST